MLKTGAEYKDLKESYVIFITRHDVLKGGEQLYHIDRVIDETNGKFADGSHILYVNCEIQDDTPLGKLIQDLFCKKPEDMYYKELREHMEYLKRTEEGVRKIMEPLAELLKEREVDIREEDMKIATDMVEQERMKAEQEKKAILRASEQEKKATVRTGASNGVPVAILAKMVNMSVQEVEAIIGR